MDDGHRELEHLLASLEAIEHCHLPCQSAVMRLEDRTYRANRCGGAVAKLKKIPTLSVNMIVVKFRILNSKSNHFYLVLVSLTRHKLQQLCWNEAPLVLLLISLLVSDWHYDVGGNHICIGIGLLKVFGDCCVVTGTVELQRACT